MKLYRFNAEPVEINPTEITQIDAHNGVMTVYLSEDIHYTGWMLRKD